MEVATTNGAAKPSEDLLDALATFKAESKGSFTSAKDELSQKINNNGAVAIMIVTNVVRESKSAGVTGGNAGGGGGGEKKKPISKMFEGMVVVLFEDLNAYNADVATTKLSIEIQPGGPKETRMPIPAHYPHEFALESQQVYMIGASTLAPDIVPGSLALVTGIRASITVGKHNDRTFLNAGGATVLPHSSRSDIQRMVVRTMGSAWLNKCTAGPDEYSNDRALIALGPTVDSNSLAKRRPVSTVLTLASTQRKNMDQTEEQYLEFHIVHAQHPSTMDFKTAIEEMCVQKIFVVLRMYTESILASLGFNNKELLDILFKRFLKTNVDMSFIARVNAKACNGMPCNTSMIDNYAYGVTLDASALFIEGKSFRQAGLLVSRAVAAKCLNVKGNTLTAIQAVSDKGDPESRAKSDDITEFKYLAPNDPSVVPFILHPKVKLVAIFQSDAKNFANLSIKEGDAFLTNKKGVSTAVDNLLDSVGCPVESLQQGGIYIFATFDRCDIYPDEDSSPLERMLSKAASQPRIAAAAAHADDGDGDDVTAQMVSDLDGAAGGGGGDGGTSAKRRKTGGDAQRQATDDSAASN